MVDLPEGVAPFTHINQNEFWGLKQKKLKEEDISVCECKYDANDPDSACGESCLNVLTSTECTPGYCPCDKHCRNQRFQKCEYAKTKLFKTDGRGWGLLADQYIKADQFIIEYCGEVISSDEAKQRSQTYEAQGLKDAYIISLNANYHIDATQKGSIARFINHSCQPNCETRKWTVLGETRVGIFAKQDISAGAELAYNYNFEWFGGTTVRCLCRAANCSLFLGAKSQGFQEYYHVWEDGDERYTVDKIPLYDSAEDEPFPQIPVADITSSDPRPLDISDYGYSLTDGTNGGECELDSDIDIAANLSVPMEGMSEQTVKTEMSQETGCHAKDVQADFPQMNAMISRIRSNSTCRNYNIGPGPGSKRKSHSSPNQSKFSGRKQVNAKNVAYLFASSVAREEIRSYEEIKNQATSELNSLYDEIRPAIEEHERDNQDSVPTSVAEKWIGATCNKWKAEFDLYFSVVKNVMCPPQSTDAEKKPPEGGNDQNEVKYLTY